MTLDKLADVVDEKLGVPSRSLLDAQQRRWVEAAPELLSDARAGRSGTLLRRLWVVPLGLAAAAALLLWIGAARKQPPAELEAAALARSALFDVELRAGERPSRVELSPDELVVLAPGTQGRARRVSREATAVDLERGELSLSLPSGTGRQWSVAAGPYRVSVVGTEFSVSWRPLARALEVRVLRGSVRVSGAEFGASGRLLGPGDRLLNGAPSEAPAAPSESVPPVSGAVQPAGSAAAAMPGWRVLAQKRSYREALAAAERDGYDGLCERLSAAELSSLADVARLAGNGIRASQALRVLRERFPGTPEAATAAFLLGRQGSSRAHAEWLEAYLREQPGGSYEQEARGRLVVMYRSLGDLTRARALASRYLAAYPKGAYAEHARALLEDGAPASSR